MKIVAANGSTNKTAKKPVSDDIAIAQEHLQTILLKLGKAIAVCHEDNEEDNETLGHILQDINLEAWRMHWELDSASGETVAGDVAT